MSKVAWDWFVTKIDEKIARCGGNDLPCDDPDRFKCDKCSQREECYKEWEEMSGNLDTHSLHYHIIRICEIVDEHLRRDTV
jgi:hypothetical protein